MKDSQPILVERVDSVGWVTINRPAKRNSVDKAARVALTEAFRDLQEDGDTRVIVLIGTGSAFCAGVDQSEAGTRAAPLRLGTRLVSPVETCELPVIAAVNGPAVGGGFELALAADLRVASQSAFFQLTELQLGSLPGSGGTQRLFTALPLAVAWRVLATGERLSAAEAAQHGLVSDVFPDDVFQEAVAAIAAKIASAAPLSLRAAKMAAQAATNNQLTTGMTLERALWSVLSRTDDREEGRAAFREKRKPDFTGQ